MVAGRLVIIILIFSLHAGLLVVLAVKQSPNIDEVAHIAAGTTVWYYGSFELYCVNPPLARAIAALPALFLPHDASWLFQPDVPLLRPEFAYGTYFVESNPDTWLLLLVFGRLLLIPFSLLGAWFCFRWADMLFGRSAGCAALLFWCFCPNVLSWSSVVGADGAATSLGVGAGYLFWRWLSEPTAGRAVAAGVFLGLCLLAKMTWLILFVSWPAIWLIGQVLYADSNRSVGQLMVIFLVGLSVLNAGFLFDGTFVPASALELHSRTLKQLFHSEGALGYWIGQLPLPLPQDYVRGIDLQKLDFENGRASYLLGEWRDSGWWYYYLLASVVKIPVGIWGLLLLSTGYRTRRGDDPRAARGIDYLTLFVPPMSLLALVSSQDGFSQHFRYALPVFPVVFIWCSRAMLLLEHGERRLAAIPFVLSTWALASSICVYPHTMSYFNEIAGGPRNGHKWCQGSTLSWSQDNFLLRRWLEQHLNAESPYVAVEWSVPLSSLGIPSKGLPPAYVAGIDEQGPVPGWHVLDKKALFHSSRKYGYFQKFAPVVEIGYSTLVYHLTSSAVSQARRELGLSVRAVSDHESLVREMNASRLINRNIEVAVFVTNSEQPTSAEQDMMETIQLSRSLFCMTAVAGDDARSGCLDGYDVLVVPGGRSSVQAEVLGSRGRDMIREFVRRGGGYVGVCAGARLAASGDEWGLGLINAEPSKGMRVVSAGKVSVANRGSGLVELVLTEAGQCLFAEMPKKIEMMFSGGPIFSGATSYSLPEYTLLATYASEVSRYPFQKGTMLRCPGIVSTRYGDGRVLLFGPHPEATCDSRRMLEVGIRACARFPSGLSSFSRKDTREVEEEATAR